MTRDAKFDFAGFSEPGLLVLMLTSSVVVLVGSWVGLVDLRQQVAAAEEPDALEKAMPPVWAVLRDKFYIDELYGATVIAFYYWWAKVADWLDRASGEELLPDVAWLFSGWAQLNRFLDANMVDGGFDKGCEEICDGGGLLARVQSGRGQMYLRLLAVAVVSAGRDPDLERPLMNAMMNGIPWLTILTVLPVVGAAIAIFSGRHARGVAQVTGVLCLRALAGDLVAFAGGWIDRACRNCTQLGAFAGRSVSPWRGWARGADAGALGAGDADGRGCGASGAP